jgi:predicted house-cleaning NTP pyrophosphatase (Maf/HAM1 superfamily)
MASRSARGLGRPAFRILSWVLREQRGLPSRGWPTAYHVDGRGAAFIESIEGSPSNVAGLPVRLVLKLAQELGVDLAIP